MLDNSQRQRSRGYLNGRRVDIFEIGDGSTTTSQRCHASLRGVVLELFVISWIFTASTDGKVSEGNSFVSLEGHKL
jgi:hypothetical protein